MSLEKEAEDFKVNKKKHFNLRLDMLYEELELFIAYSLHYSDERDHALTRLCESKLWCKNTEDRYGLK